MPWTIHDVYGLIFRVWRKKRHALFAQRIKPVPTDRILDVGGLPVFWAAVPQSVEQIDTVNMHPPAWDARSAPHHRITVRAGDGCRLDIPDQSYEIAFSNSVIEHVGTWENQRAFAREIRRVGKSIWVQTPAFECPIEPHYLTPFVHYFPKRIRGFVARWFTIRSLIERPTKEQSIHDASMTRLLRKREFQELFPDCEILTERLFWLFPKSYIAIRLGSADSPNRSQPVSSI